MSFPGSLYICLLSLPSRKHEWAPFHSRAVSALPPTPSCLGPLPCCLLHLQCLPPHFGLLFSAYRHALIYPHSRWHFPISPPDTSYFSAFQVFQMNIPRILITHSVLNCFNTSLPLPSLLKCFLKGPCCKHLLLLPLPPAPVLSSSGNCTPMLLLENHTLSHSQLIRFARGFST